MTMKKLSENIPAIAFIAGGLSVAIALYATSAFYEHSLDRDAHPSLSQAIRDNAAENRLLRQAINSSKESLLLRIDLNQKNNDVSFQRIMDSIAQLQQVIASK